MKLLITPTSPYARKACIVALEKDINCEFVVAVPWDDDPLVTQNNPVRKIPVLLADDGTAIVDSTVICEFLDAQNDTPKFLPSDFNARLAVKNREAIALGGMDAALAVIMAKRVAPDMQGEAWTNWLLAKTDGALNAFEQLAEQMNPDAPDMADITLGCLVGMLDFRLPGRDWRNNRPALAVWWEKLSARDSFQQTIPKM